MHDKTIEFFKEICKIPHGSGNEIKIAKYLCEFAKERNLEYSIDNFNNVIIKKNTSNGRVIILQAHTDMVCEKIEDIDFDFEKDEIKVLSDGKFLYADGTTLGADNGIGVAQILNILDSDIKCNIEAVFTTSEETSMSGAINIDVSSLKGKYLLNLDGFTEHTIINESSSFYDLILKLNSNITTNKVSECYKIKVYGLEGGHSGFEINNNKGNSIKIMADLLTKIEDIELININGGTKYNVIPSICEAEFYSKYTYEELETLCYYMKNNLRSIYPSIDISLNISNGGITYSNTESIRIINLLNKLYHGVLLLDSGLPITSVNLGIINLKEDNICLGMRSSRIIEEEKYLNYLRKLCSNNNCELIIYGHQPGFENSKDSKLIQALLKTAPNKEDTLVKSVHITIEAGFFKEKIPDVEIAVISPNILDAHTPKERVEIASVKETNLWLENFITYFDKINN